MPFAQYASISTPDSQLAVKNGPPGRSGRMSANDPSSPLATNQDVPDSGRSGPAMVSILRRLHCDVLAYSALVANQMVWWQSGSSFPASNVISSTWKSAR